VDGLVGGKGSDTYAPGSSRNDVIIEAAGLSNGIDTITSTSADRWQRQGQPQRRAWQ
jgi:hypothetical protein